MSNCLFTVEQIELIRRLRKTGVTPKQIVQAFAVLDQLDHELFRDIPAEKRQQVKGLVATKELNGCSSAPDPNNESACVEHSRFVAQNCGVKAEPNWSNSDGAASDNGSDSPAFSTGHSLYGDSQQPQFQIVEDPQKLAELLKSGDDAIMQDIRQFISQYNLRQQAIATMTGVSQPYVSKFLRGDTRDISSRIKHVMYNWYLTCLNNIDRMVEFCSDPTRRLYVSDGKLMSQRRERFTFKPFHSEILEHAYMQNPYPSQQERELLAQGCNNATRVYKPALEGPVCARDLVSPQVISNWFANRRKEMKKEASQYSPYPILPSRGRRQYNLFNKSFCNSSVEEDNSDYTNPNSSGREPVEKDEHMESMPDESEETEAASDVQAELDAINSSVMALVYPYTKEDSASENDS